MDAINSVFVIFSALLVWLMTPAITVFYESMVSDGDRSSTLKMGLMPLGIIFVVWLLIGYSLAFEGKGLFVGDGFHLALSNMSMVSSSRGLAFPDVVFAIFQGMFPLITIAIIVGGVVGRFNVYPFSLLMVAWLLLIYVPLAHMVWGGGLIAQLGAIDFAGGTVVHISSGVTALTLILLAGPRQHITQPKVYRPTGLVIGGTLLWFGWFGFNGGSALAMNASAIQAVLNTALAASVGMVIWTFLTTARQHSASISDYFLGALTGLVVITPAAGYIQLTNALFLVMIATPAVFYLMTWAKQHFNYDDTLDAFGLHGIGGIVGGLLTGVFAEEKLAGVKGGFAGNWPLLGQQSLAIIITIVWTVVGTVLLFKLINIRGHLAVKK